MVCCSHLRPGTRRVSLLLVVEMEVNVEVAVLDRPVGSGMQREAYSLKAKILADSGAWCVAVEIIACARWPLSVSWKSLEME